MWNVVDAGVDHPFERHLAALVVNADALKCRRRQRAKDAGVGDRVKFEIAKAKDYPGNDYDFVTFFDCLHDMGDPTGAAKHVRQSLGADGTWLIVEPYASDTVEGNLNPVGRIY